MTMAVCSMARAQNEFLFEGSSVEWGDDQVLAVSDFDLDGRPDVVVDSFQVVGGEFEYGVEVRLARPDGTYAEPVFYADVLYFVRIADVTADGWPDLVALDGEGTELMVLPGIGAGALGPPILSAVDLPALGFGGLAIGDIDADGSADVALAEFTQQTGCQCVDLYMGDGSGHFVPGGTAIVAPRMGDTMLRDFDGDGTLDLFSTRNPPEVASTPDAAAVALGDGHGGFLPPTSSDLPVRAGNVVAIDLDDDGRLDLVTGTWEPDVWASVSVFENVDGSSFVLRHKIPLQIRGPSSLNSAAVTIGLADLDEDGLVDIVAATGEFEASDAMLFVLKGLGDFDFGPPADHALAGAPTGLAIADLDLDGHQDLVVSHPFRITFLRGTGDGSFALADQVDIGQPALDIASGDVNSDGHIDLVTANGAPSSALALRLGTGDGHFTGALPPPSEPPFVQRVLLADVSGDAILDLVEGTSALGRTLQVQLGLGDGGFRPPRVLDSDTTADIEVADLDGDGLVDILNCDPELQVVRVHRASRIGTVRGAGRLCLGWTLAAASQWATSMRTSGSTSSLPTLTARRTNRRSGRWSRCPDSVEAPSARPSRTTPSARKTSLSPTWTGTAISTPCWRGSTTTTPGRWVSSRRTASSCAAATATGPSGRGSTSPVRP
jgi:hypothetical protein